MTTALAQHDPLVRAVGLIEMLMVRWDSAMCDEALDELEKVIDTRWIVANAVASHGMKQLQVAMDLKFLPWRWAWPPIWRNPW